jgi:hypothetical protein
VPSGAYSPHMRRWVSLGVFLALATATGVALLPLCGVLHRCGCRAPWAGGESHCNVHNSEGPHCPWCEHRALGGLAAAGTIGGQGLAFLLVRRRGGPLRRSALAAVGVLPVSLLVSGAAAWLLTDYPHFLVENARERLGVPKGPLRCVLAGPRTGASCCPEARPSRGP